LTELSAAFTVVASVLLVALPRRFAAVPLLLCAAYLPKSAALDLGAATFTVLRILVVVGVIRVVVRGERIEDGINTVDRLLLLWALCLIGTSAFHTSNAWVYRAGIVWADLGVYFLFRVFLRHREDLVRTLKLVCVLLTPLALMMLLEKTSGHNFFVAFGALDGVAVRDGAFRARGPFSHAILAGTVGAACLPVALYLWKRHRRHALMGLFAATGIVAASTSSGPIMMSAFIIFGMLLWKFRTSLRPILWLGLLGVIALDFLMKAPVYFLIARIDIAGGSKGWHRAQLIRSAIEHLDEWWLAGTDQTRHWMATGIGANEMHTDITNHLLAAGVMGGLPLVLILVLIIAAAFRAVGRSLRNNDLDSEHRFLAWTLGAILFGHVMNFLSISLFDQSVVFFYLVLAAIAAVQRASPVARADSSQLRWWSQPRIAQAAHPTRPASGAGYTPPERASSMEA
jgi:hypothetical protein